MDLHTVKVRLAGSLDNEVIKHNVTAAEIHLLNLLHAGQHPATTDIKLTGTVNRTDAAERKRLADEYTKGELVEDRGNKLIQSLFGVAGVPLPQKYVAPVTTQVEESAEEAEEEVILPIAEVPAPVVAKTATKKQTAADLIA